MLAAISSAMVFCATALNQFCFVEDLLSKSAAIRSGAEHLVGMTKQQYMRRLTWVKELMRFNATNWSDRKNFERVSHTLEMLKLDDSNGSLRKQPYCILLTGYPGCGKSSYALQIAAACVRARYGISTPNDIVILNETDEFQSEYRSSHRVVIFDDLGAEVMRTGTVNPWRKIIDFVNNIRKTSLNPNVEMKGNVYIEPDVVIITTNLRNTMNINHFQMAPNAIYRRLKKIVELSRNFKTARVIPVCKANIDSVNAYDDGSRPDRHSKGIDTERDLLLQEIVGEFQQHMEEQEKFVLSANAFLDKVPVSDSFLRCLYEDMILPNWPRCIPLDTYIECQLPFYHRWWRRICVKEENVAICMNRTTQMFDSIIPHALPYDDHLLLDFINAHKIWDLYAIHRDELSEISHLVLYDGMIWTAGNVFSLTPAEGVNQYETTGIATTFEQLERLYVQYEKNRHKQYNVIEMLSSLWTSMLGYVLHPILFKRIPLDAAVESRLPFYHRWWRKMCVDDEDMAVCMSVDPTHPQSFFDIELEERLEEVNDIDSFLALPASVKRELIELVTLRGVNWEVYGRLRFLILRDDVIAIHPSSFANRFGIFSTGEPIYDYEQIKVDLGPRILLSVTKTERYYRKYLREQSEQDSSSDSSDTIDMIWHSTYRASKEILEVKDLEQKRKWMNTDLENKALGTLRKNDSMIVVQYLLAMRSSNRGFLCLGVEFPFSKMTPDVVLKAGDVFVIIECKNSKNNIGKKQVEKYMRVCHDSGDLALGVLFTQREVKFYSMDPIQRSMLQNTRLLIQDVLLELAQRHVAFGTDHFRRKEDRCGAVEDLNTLQSIFVEYKLPLQGFISQFGWMRDVDTLSLELDGNFTLINQPTYEFWFVLMGYNRRELV